MTNATIIAFHIGRGGRFYNSGHLSYAGVNKITHFTENLFLGFENAWEVGKKIGNRPNLQDRLQKAIEDWEIKDDSAFFERIGLPLGEIVYMDGGGFPVGLTFEEAQTGIGTIEIDGDYNTTYTKRLEDINEKEAKVIMSTDWYVDEDVLDYAKQLLEQD